MDIEESLSLSYSLSLSLSPPPSLSLPLQQSPSQSYVGAKFELMGDFQAQIEVLEAEVALLRRKGPNDAGNSLRLLEAENRLREALSLANDLEGEINKVQHHAHCQAI